MTFLRKVWVVFLLVVSGPVWGVTNMPIALADFPEARLVFSSQEPATDYVLALGNYKKVRGLWRVDEQRLSGELFKKTYQLPDNHSALDGYRFVTEQLRSHPVRELYSCSARECGDSNSWAINHFGILQLYGLDQYQYYGAFELTSAQHAGIYVTVYSVLRGNKRVYLHVEMLVSDQSNRYQAATNPTTMVRQLRQQGYTVFAGLRKDGSGEEKTYGLAVNHVQALAAALRSEPHLKVALVGHNYQRIPLDQQKVKSLAYAVQLQDALVELGIPRERIIVEGVGGLAPAGRGDDQARLDVVLLPAQSAP
ncbi:DUF4892 domain-containing protein [Gilvimarinus sp. SDUM040013]|uniref:DUF4892 domain-containing protein n=1 Tax=Gilvimarinus gilvus TaxID=3058038 RepID=A0ABU4RYI2_9GAMM|nr:DUF4892 domain-containing protein [Gilvimarinus sp. SDUM040013]MDO3386458.1 DUF4892 domain-containing protein [Gilvimarinus sp. SDUM040013]MDX6849724.1 DUF4892 domain-containing protein [Gilvimarinus sp. SDUM040013]